MRKKHLILGVATLLAGLGAVTVIRGAAAPRVEVVRPMRGQAVEAVYATGTVEATVMMPIASRNTARLLALNVDEGSEVKQGQVMGQLEDADIRQALEAAQARETLAGRDYKRQQSLAARHFVSRSALDQAKAEWDAAQATVAQTAAQLDFLKLMAPADGVVIRRDGEIGQLIPANQPVFWISCCAPLRISAEVDEEDIPLVKVGQSVAIRADAFPGQVFDGAVLSITPKGDPVARSYRVRVSLPGDVPLKIGMTAETNIIQRIQENAILLPASAVAQDTVWKVVDDRLAAHKVTLGAKNAEKVEIREGVGPEEMVVLQPDPSLAEGKRVRAAPASDRR